MRKSVSIFCALIMLFSVIPVQAQEVAHAATNISALSAAI